MKQKKALHQWGGNFLHIEAKVLQGDKVMFDQQILMNNDKKFWLQTTNFFIVSELKIIWKFEDFKKDFCQAFLPNQLVPHP